ncbi:unnamed protein product [Triticum turgidum subsp. durum]|uniref:FLZ-type domain-containing protein n=1 Tax=Triticum turgidum subsp. durum TaxID=4567 RepID=A0A9R1RS51_TRITD|nr:unnamed protein product [Triticum turgidum subsp. durum]
MAASVACAFFFDAEPVGEPGMPALDACALCAKLLARDSDVFMYRGDTPYAARSAATSRCTSTPSAPGRHPGGSSGSRRRRSATVGSGSPGRCPSRASRPAAESIVWIHKI